MQSVKRFGSHSHSSIKAECPLCAGQIIINGLGYANNLNITFTRQLGTYIQATVTADNNQGFYIVFTQVFNNLFAHILIYKLTIFFNSKMEGIITVCSS